MRSTVCMLGLLLFLGATGTAAAQAAKPRSLGDVVSLVRSGVSNGRIVDLVNRDCISFTMDSDAERRLTTAGAASTVVQALRSTCVRTDAAGATQPEQPASEGAAAPYRARATRIAFFERGLQAPPLRQRVLATRFAKATTRYVGVMVDLAYSPPASPVRVPLVCTYLKPNGEALGTVELNMLLSSRGTAYDAGAVGSNDPGEWRSGTYGVVCALNGAPVGRATFTID